MCNHGPGVTMDAVWVWDSETGEKELFCLKCNECIATWGTTDEEQSCD